LRQFIEIALASAPHLIESALRQLEFTLQYAVVTDLVFVYIDEDGHAHVGWARERAYYQNELSSALATSCVADLIATEAL